MKTIAILPMAGKAVRMRGIFKEFLPIPYRDRLLFTVEFSMLMLQKINPDYVVIVTSPIKAPHHMSILGDGSIYNMHFVYVVQREAKGLGDAILRARFLFSRDDIGIMLMPDTIIFPLDAVERVYKKLVDSDCILGIGLHYVSNPEKFGVAIFEQGRIKGFIDKPVNPPSNYVWTFICFREKFFDLIIEANRNTSKEIGVTEALDLAIKKNYSVCVEKFDRGIYIDVGSSMKELKNLYRTILRLEEFNK